jgi:histone deacetylase complex subunit SAP30
MPPAKKTVTTEDSRSDASTVRERQIAAAAHARKSKQNAAAVAAASARENGSALKELAAASVDADNAAQAPGVSFENIPLWMFMRVGLTDVQMAWSTTPLSLLNTYRVSHNLSTPAAFTSPLNQALLVNPGIGRQSPTMARRKDKRRVSREQLATNVRKHFNGAAVNEIDVVVELVYKSRNKGRT